MPRMGSTTPPCMQPGSSPGSPASSSKQQCPPYPLPSQAGHVQCVSFLTQPRLGARLEEATIYRVSQEASQAATGTMKPSPGHCPAPGSLLRQAGGGGLAHGQAGGQGLPALVRLVMSHNCIPTSYYSPPQFRVSKCRERADVCQRKVIIWSL